jgi:hypothetical protein
MAQWEPLVSLPPEPMAVAAQPAEPSQKLEPQLESPEASQPANGRDAQKLASLGVPQGTLVAEQLVALEQRMSA